MFRWLGQLLGCGGSRPPADPLARQGEDAAAAFLRLKGFRIIARNFRCRMGEVDIIAREGDELVFVEVKTRREDHPTPEQQVNAEKQRKLVQLAKFYLSRYGRQPPPARFDVVAVVCPEDGHPPLIRHTPGAFGA